MIGMARNAPPYESACHVCRHVNAADPTRWSDCRFEAVASAEEIARKLGEPDPAREGYRAVGKATGWFALIVGLFISS